LPARPKRSPQHGCSPQPGAVGLGAVGLGAVPGAVALGAVPGAVALGAVALTEVMPWLSGSSIDTSLVVVVLAVVIGRILGWRMKQTIARYCSPAATTSLRYMSLDRSPPSDLSWRSHVVHRRPRFGGDLAWHNSLERFCQVDRARADHRRCRHKLDRSTKGVVLLGHVPCCPLER